VTAAEIQTRHYTGRFAPSPTGPLHAGSLVAALASWLDARAHGGRWLLRIEDTDTPRCVPGAAQTIAAQLAACGLLADEPVTYQSANYGRYATALQQLVASGQAYPCGCSRSDVQALWAARAARAARGVQRPPGTELPYPGTCRGGLNGKPARAWRLRCAAQTPGVVHWFDRALGPQQQDVPKAVGDFVLKRADGLWAYQLAVVVDDAAQGVTHVVRGQDLADNTPRQLLLQRALHLPTPLYLHTPLVLAADGQKLSKQTGAKALDVSDGEPQALAALQAAGQVLGLPLLQAASTADWLGQAVPAWAGLLLASSRALPTHGAFDDDHDAFGPAV
jgi:glutamyl-Q tRNA(Asp) synthetase